METPLYYGDNGTQEFYEDTALDTVIIKNHGDPPTANWICISLNGSLSPEDKARQKGPSLVTGSRCKPTPQPPSSAASSGNTA